MLFAAYAERLPHLPLIFAAERMLADPELQGWDIDPQVMFGTGLEKWAFVDEGHADDATAP